MFYERFVMLCKARGVSPSRAAVDAGLSKSTVSKWKRSPDSSPTGAVIDKLTRYFGISVAELLGEETGNEVRREDIKFALFGGGSEITDEMYDEVLSFAEFVKQRETQKNGKKGNNRKKE